MKDLAVNDVEDGCFIELPEPIANAYCGGRIEWSSSWGRISWSGENTGTIGFFASAFFPTTEEEFQQIWVPVDPVLTGPNEQ